MTGSRKGMTVLAKEKLQIFLDHNIVTEGHHGDCIGADQIFHNILVKNVIKTYIHPPIDGKYRAFCIGNFIYEKKEYLERNKKIVDETDILIAFPSEKEEQLRSGTWSTIRYARKQGKEIYIIFPNGETKSEND